MTANDWLPHWEPATARLNCLGYPRYSERVGWVLECFDPGENQCGKISRKLIESSQRIHHAYEAFGVLRLVGALW